MKKLTRPILITGLMGSGKSMIAHRIISEYKLPSLSMAVWIKETVRNHYELGAIDKSIEINGKAMRTILQDVGESMRAIDPNWHIDEVLKLVSKYKLKNFVIDDIRFKHEHEVLNKHFNCINIKVNCSMATRLERIIMRDMVVPTDSQLMNSSEIEVTHIPSDYIINNNGDIDTLYDQIDHILRRKIHESTEA